MFSWTSRLYFALLFLVLLLPLALPGSPPLVDYPNHLARMVIAFEPSPALAHYYSFHWQNISNLGLEGSLAFLTLILPVEQAMQVFVGATLALSLGGVMALHRALFGRLSVRAGIAAFFVWGGAIQFGFLSYCLGIGLSLWAVAGWVACVSRPLWLRLCYGALVCLALYYVHVLALVAYGLVVAGIEAHAALTGGKHAANSLLRRIGIALLLGAQVLPVVWLVLRTRAGDAEAMTVHFTSLRNKLVSFQRLFWDENLWISVLMMLVTLGFCVLLMLRRRLPVDPRLAPGVLLLALAWLLLPAGVITGGTPNWALDWRFLTPAALFLAASLRDPWQGQHRNHNWALAAVTLILVSLRVTLMATGSWASGAAIETELRSCLARHVETNARLITFALPMNRDSFRWPEHAPPVSHMASLAVVDRAALIPSLFAYKNQQPLQYLQEWAGVSDGFEAIYFQKSDRVDWVRVRKWEYLLAFVPSGRDPRHEAEALPVTLSEPLCQGERFALFRIEN